MYGASRDSMGSLSDSVESRRAVASFGSVSGDLLAVADLVGGSMTLRSTLADSGIPPAGRKSLVDALLSDQLSPLGLDFVEQVAVARWSHEADVVQALETMGAQAALIDAQDAGTLDQVEDELFRFGRAVQASAELQLTLTDPALAADRKAAVVRDLLGTGSAPATVALLTYLAGHLRGQSLESAIGRLSGLAAAQRDRVVADVQAAIALSDDQQARLTTALSALTGRQVKLNVEITPELLGGVVVKIGDQVIDGSISNRLEQARRALAG